RPTDRPDAASFGVGRSFPAARDLKLAPKLAVRDRIEVARRRPAPAVTLVAPVRLSGPPPRIVGLSPIYPARRIAMAQLSPLLKQATPVLAARGEGVYLWDEADRRYLDFTAGIGVTSTGHCHPRVVEAAQRQVATLIHGQYTTVMHRPLLTLVERLGEVLPERLDSMFFVNSGSEAVEASVRLARHA